MFLIYGKKTAKLKTYKDHRHACSSCKSFGYNIYVFRDYYHLYFIPVLPIGNKTFKIHCVHCGEPPKNDLIHDHYKSLNWTPFYLYSGVIIICGVILMAFLANHNTQKEKAEFVANPKTGDVYMIRDDEKSPVAYTFLRVSAIKGDTVFAHPNSLEYGNYVSKLNDEDFFVKDIVLSYTKNKLKEMLESAKINSVERGYEKDEGFERLR